MKLHKPYAKKLNSKSIEERKYSGVLVKNVINASLGGAHMSIKCGYHAQDLDEKSYKSLFIRRWKYVHVVESIVAGNNPHSVARSELLSDHPNPKF
jgi:hypothetical protein